MRYRCNYFDLFSRGAGSYKNQNKLSKENPRKDIPQAITGNASLKLVMACRADGGGGRGA